MRVKVSHTSCQILCSLIDCSLPGYSVHRILQERILEWVANSFSKGSFWLGDWTQVSCIAGRFFTNLATREAALRRVKKQIKSIVSWKRDHRRKEKLYFSSYDGTFFCFLDVRTHLFLCIELCKFCSSLCSKQCQFWLC